MNFHKLTLLLMLSVCQSAFSQNDTLNRYDSNEKKTGWWIVYLDDNLAELKDSSEATYYRFNLFKGNHECYNMGPIGTKKNPVIFPENNSTIKPGIQRLNGVYKANYKSGVLKFQLEVHDGKLTDYQEFYENGILKTHFDYTKSCGDSPFNYCVTTYKKDGSIKYEGYAKTP
jgi:antitoxin component YwqK of YwqJK toxin-antitoxin module